MDVVLALAAGFVAGVVNTLAGSGSVVTLALLSFLGLSTPVANGTNRLGVLLQSAVSTWTFRRSGAELPPGPVRLVAVAVAGSVAGAAVAVDIDEVLLNRAVAVLMAVMLVVVVTQPDQWLRDRPAEDVDVPGVGALLAFFGIGVYGGFIQAGVGVIMLAAMVLLLGYDVTTANYLKVVVVLVYTVPALGVFVANGQVAWRIGAVLAVGQSAGAFAAARFAAENERANVWVRRLLVVVIVVGILRFSGILG